MKSWLRWLLPVNVQVKSRKMLRLLLTKNPPCSAFWRGLCDCADKKHAPHANIFSMRVNRVTNSIFHWSCLPNPKWFWFALARTSNSLGIGMGARTFESKTSAWKLLTVCVLWQRPSSGFVTFHFLAQNTAASIFTKKKEKKRSKQQQQHKIIFTIFTSPRRTQPSSNFPLVLCYYSSKYRFVCIQLMRFIVMRKHSFRFGLWAVTISFTSEFPFCCNQNKHSYRAAIFRPLFFFFFIWLKLFNHLVKTLLWMQCNGQRHINRKSFDLE